MNRFDFGKNWVSFSRTALTKEHIEQARVDFFNLFDGIPLEGKTFLDIGFGQGLALLFASEAGAKVVGCDIDPDCYEALKITFSITGSSVDFPVFIGSILSDKVIKSISNACNGAFDIVHSWGVLHHTGNMTKALSIVCNLTRRNGYLVMAIYNRHWTSPIWKEIKKVYCHSPVFIRKIFILSLIPVISLAKYSVTGSNPFKQSRGMDFYHDIVDWIGGYPYEFASIDEVRSLIEARGFSCRRVIPARVPTGCNQFVFQKNV